MNRVLRWDPEDLHAALVKRLAPAYVSAGNKKGHGGSRGPEPKKRGTR